MYLRIYVCMFVLIYVCVYVYVHVRIYSAHVAQAVLPVSHAALYLPITLAWLLQPDVDRHIEYIHEGDLRIFPRKTGPSASSVQAYLKSFLDLS